MTELDEGNPPELGRLYRGIRHRLPQVHLLGGCCGTDIRHLRAIGEACAAAQPEITPAMA
jgi:methionine synthase I (cobalamin-dependent)